MAFHYDTICHFRCNRELPHWESFPPLWPEVWHKRNVGCHENGKGGGDIQAYNRLPMPQPFVKTWLCSILYCDEKALNGLSRKHNSAFSLHCVFPVGSMPQTLAFHITVTYKGTCNYLWHCGSKGLCLFKFTNLNLNRCCKVFFTGWLGSALWATHTVRV